MRPCSLLRLLSVALLAAALPACGGDDIEFEGGGDEPFDLDVTDEAAVDADLLDETEAPLLDDEHSLEPDLEPLMPPASEFGAISQGAYDGTPQVVFVNFGGPTIRHCSNYCSDATTNRSFAIGQAMKRSSVNFEPYTNAAGRRTILANLRAWFRPNHVTFTTTRPAQGPYTMLVISPTYWDHHGVAPLDCGNANRSDIAFVFRAGRSSFYTSATKIAQAAAHELGHSFGLSHVTGAGQIMQWASSGRAFGRSPYDHARPSGKCFSGNVQDAPRMLRASVGPRP
jgi:hypothetical protein